MATIQLAVEKRNSGGTGAARAVRREAKIPGIIYGGKSGQLPISIPVKEFTLAFQKGNLKSKLVELDVEGKKLNVVTRDVQVHPVSDKPIHVDFQELEQGGQVRIEVPVFLLNRDKSPGIKRGGVLNVVRRKIEVTCGLNQIPEQIEVDLGNLQIGDAVHISHVKLPEGVKPTITDRDFTIATVVGRQKEEDLNAPVASALPAELQEEKEALAAEAAAAKTGGVKPAAGGAAKAPAAPAAKK